MSIVAVIPVANMAAANEAIEQAGFGPGNFSVTCYGPTGPTHAALHCWEAGVFLSALQELAGVVLDTQPGNPITRTQALIEAAGARWGDRAPELPDEGNVNAGEIYQRDGTLWAVIQTFNRTTFNAPPETYPALIRELRRPGEVKAWRQPIDQFDSFRLVNPFTGRADETLHGGKRWRTTIDFNVNEPGTLNSGWVEVDADGNVFEAPAPEEWPEFVQPTGAHDAYQQGAKVTFQGSRYISLINNNVWSPAAYPQGWQAQP